MRKSAESGFRQGLDVGGLCAGLVLAVGFALVVPTNEYRARVYFLLENPSDATLYAFFMGALTLAGLLGLLLTGELGPKAVLGVVVASTVATLAVATGGLKWLPEFHSRVARGGITILSTGLCLAILVRRRLQSRRTRPTTPYFGAEP